MEKKFICRTYVIDNINSGIIISDQIKSDRIVSLMDEHVETLNSQFQNTGIKYLPYEEDEASEKKPKK
jgi:hypothetical protein